MCKVSLPKGFLSVNGNPTQNSLIMFFVYLTFLPKDWNIQKIHKGAVEKVREYFGWTEESGFDVMIKWGVSVNCARSKTSKKRYIAMSKSFHDARGMIGKGYVLTNVQIQKV